MDLLQSFIEGYTGYANYLWNEITFNYDYKPWYENYFYWLIAVSVFFFALEQMRPWRINQPKFRKDFWLDVFYMFFNFFLFSLVIYNAASNVVVDLFNSALAAVGITNLLAFEVMSWPFWAHFIVAFFVRDFTQWWTHRLLHRVDWLWQFHKVHHSVKEMGFAAHLRYHWMETIVYRSIEYIPLALIGIGLKDFFILHMLTLAIGHWNHSNFTVNLGFLKYFFNNPEMHIWHHAKHIPSDKPYGVNFGISLSLWDYIFGTAYIPYNGRDIELGFDNDEQFPQSFAGQSAYGILSGKEAENIKV